MGVKVTAAAALAPVINLAVARLERELLHNDRNGGPALLLEAVASGAIGPDGLRRLLPGVWCAAEWPGRCLPRRVWLQLFDMAGFVSDDGSPPPPAMLEVWRAQVGRTRGLSWTADRDRALWFHRRNVSFEYDPNRCRLIHTIVEPKAVLALINGRSESEVIVHPKHIRWVLP